MAKKVLKYLVILIGTFVLCFIALTFYLVSYNNTPIEGKEQILQSNTNQPKKLALIAYHPSKTDMSDEMAKQIAKGLNDNGYEVTLNYAGDKLSTDVSRYSVLVFGSPTYASHMSKALTDYVSKINLSKASKIALFATGMSTDTQEIDILENSNKNMKVFKKIKFCTKQKNENDKIAYNLGKELAKE